MSSAAHAVRWTSGASVVRALGQFAQTLVLARLIAPEDFGLMAIAGAFVAVLALFSDVGLSRALIHFPAPSPSVRSTLYWLNLLASLVLMALVCICAPVVARLYGNDELVVVLCGTSLVFPFGAIGQQFRALAEKDLRFKRLVKVELLGFAFGMTTAVLLAAQNAGVYALVGGILVNALATSVLCVTLLSSGRLPQLSFAWTEARQHVRFGAALLSEQLVGTLRMQLDVLIAGTLASPSGVGYYAVPRDLSLRIAGTLVNPIVTRVGFPLLARANEDPVAMKRIYLKMVRMTAGINFPIFLAIAVFAEEVVAVYLGQKWGRAVPFLQIMAIWGMVRAVGNPVGSLLHAAGMVRRSFWWNVALLLTMPLAWLVAAKMLDGMIGLAWGVLFTQLVVVVPAWRFLIRPACGASLMEYLRELARPLTTSALAAAVGLLAAALVEGSFQRLTLGLTMGFLSYLGASWLLNRKWLEGLWAAIPRRWTRTLDGSTP